jgi:rhodanese-related sulfurtransferase/glutaredoxin
MIRWMLMLVIPFLFVHACVHPQGRQFNAHDFAHAIDRFTDEWIIDVRTKREFESGHLANAINIDFYAGDFNSQLASLPKDRPLMLYCHSGSRSAAAMDRLVLWGYDQVYHLQGGIQSWIQAGLPLEKEKQLADKYTAEDFHRVVSAHRFLMVYFHAPWCLPCRKMKPSIEKLQAAFAPQVHVEHIHADEAKMLARQKEINQLPVLIFIADGKEKSRLYGFQSEEDIRKQLQALITHSKE